MEKDWQISSLLDIYGGFLNAKQYRLIEQYYNEDLSLSEIAENEGITRQGVQDQIKRAVSRLYTWEEKCRYLARFLELKSLAHDLRAGEKDAYEKLLSLIDEL